MAQVDTGLGWSAKDEWLLSASAVVGSINTVSGAQELPYCASENDVAANGILIERQQYGNYVRLWKIGLKTPNCNAYAYILTSNYRCYVFSNLRGAEIQYVRVREDTGVILDRYTIACTGTGSTVPGGFYGSDFITGQYDVLAWGPIPQYPTYQDAISAIQQTSTTFVKDNPGPAVACLAKWVTSAGVVINTPILISSVSEYTDMSTDSSYTLSKLNIRYDGIQFYMAFFPISDATVSSSMQSADLTYLPVLALQGVFNVLASEDWANILVNETVDPYEDFGYTGEDAGEINPDPQDDDIDFDDLPTKSFATAGFCRIFNPDVSDLNDLASYMWTDQNFLQTVINHLKQILENPIEAIISLSMVPVQPPVGSSKVPVNVMFINTGVSMRPVTSQFVTVDCGTTVLQECYGGALDYNPYTRVQIYLPYIGIVQLDTDEVMAKTLHLQYHIDVVTGICCAEIKADNKLLYSFSGHCAVSQPITSADFSSYLNAAVAAAKVAVGVATGMASTTAGAAAAELPPAVPSKAQTSSALVPLQSSGAIGPHLGSPGLSGSHSWTDFSDIPEPQSNGGTAWGELAKPGNVNTVASAMGGKMVVQHSGGFSGNSGYLAKRRPYLIIIRPRIANPRNYAQHFGRTSMEYLNLGSCTGYTKVQSVHLSGFDATNPELSEISSLLKGGVLM